MNDFLFLASPVLVFALVTALQYGLEAGARRTRLARSQATKGLTPGERAQRRAAAHLDRERVRAIADLGTDWVLHRDYKHGGR